MLDYIITQKAILSLANEKMNKSISKERQNIRQRHLKEIWNVVKRKEH